MSSLQPICTKCWFDKRVQKSRGVVEGGHGMDSFAVCAMCGSITPGGIRAWVVDPLYPTLTDDTDEEAAS